MPTTAERGDRCRVLSLDGGGAKGFYTLGVLKEVEAMIGCRPSERFDLIFGTSTGAIIAALAALGRSVDEIHDLYKKHVPNIVWDEPHTNLSDRCFDSDKTFVLSRIQ